MSGYPRVIPPLTCSFEGESPLFTVLFALAFSLAVVALIGVGVTTGFGRVVDQVKVLREKVSVKN